MVLVAYLTILMFQLLLVSKLAQLQPTFSSQPSNPSTVEEGWDLILQWNYNLDRQSNLVSRIVNVTAGALQNLALRGNGENATVEAGYENLFRATITDTQATLTIIAVPKSINGEKYQLRIVTASPNFFGLTSEEVEISVLFKPQNIQLLTNATSNQACLGSYLNFTCSVGSANPPVTSYQLLKNDVVVDTSSSGMWIRMLPNIRVIAYKCLANNTVGTANSTSVIITFGVPPTIQPLQNKTITEGGNLNLYCNASGTPQPVVSWARTRSGLQFNGSLLQLTNVFRNQAGDYRCEASNTCGTKSSTARICVKSKPIVTIQQCRTPVTEGDNVTLHCNATGFPVPNISWIKASSGYVESHTKTLLVTAITRGESSNYICHASNEIGNDTQTCEIDVHYGPTVSALSTIPSNTTMLRGSRVSFNCTTDANPAANIYHFYFNGIRIGSDPSGVFNHTVQDDGVYTCVPINTVGTRDNATVDVIVVDAPLVEINTTAATVLDGESVTLYCKATGKPHPTLTWTIAGSPVVLSNNAILTTGPLKRNDTINDLIQYQCTASNGVERPTTAFTKITVYFHPKIIKPNSSTMEAEHSKRLTIECLAEANPPPSYVWKNAAGGIETHGRFLSVQNVDDLDGRNYTYTCTATNILGFDKRSVLIEITRREIPLELTLERFNGAKIVYQPDYNNLNSTLAKSFVNKFVVEVNKKYENNPKFDKAEVNKLGEGSVIVSLILYFRTPVTTNDGLAELTDALIMGTIGPFSVCCLRILDEDTTAAPSSISSTISLTSSAVPSPPTETERCQCNEFVWKAVTGVVIFVIILLIVVIIWQHKRGSRGQKRPYALPRDDAEVYDNELALDEIQSSHSRQRKTEYMDLKEVPAFESKRKEELTLSTPQVECSSLATDYAPLHPSTRSWEVPRNNVTIEKVIGKGAFGQVAKGIANDLRGRPANSPVAVKMLKASAPESDRSDLLSELEVMKTLKPHPHVIRLLGCVTETEPLLVLIEYVPYGDLLGYLRKSRGLNDTYFKDPDIKPRTNLTSEQLMKFAWQIADGMSYLSSRSIIHRDLAARNVLVGERETCKVTDFGMARNVQQENIYERKTRGRLPVKWTAYEALMFNTYTTKSDIWSYGVVLYEIFTVGGSPYPRMDGKKIASLLQQEYRMPKPQHVDDKLYQIMTNCWQNEPKARPSFTALTKQLRDMENQHKKLINMHIYDNQLYAKVEDLNV